jgi:hypothetical protein
MAFGTSIDSWRARCPGSSPRRYGLERTLALGFGLPPLAHARAARTISGVWR